MIKPEHKVSCIVPAYNEERTIAGVVKTCLKTPEIGEVIVVNDGSTDRTSEKLSEFQNLARIINLPKNRGKGYAVAQGVKVAKYGTLLFLDADLINLKPHHLSSLTRPVTDQKVEMTIGILKSLSSLNYSFIWQLSGQRCFPKKLLLPILKNIKTTNYGLEILLNEAFKDRLVFVVPLISQKPLHINKEYKQKDWLAAYIQEIWEVSQQILAHRSKTYRRRFQKELIESLSSYLKISIKKIKEYLEEI